jgi:hypothetical protein
MDKKRLTLSFIELFLALAALIVVSFAWFAANPQVSSAPLQFSISHEYVQGYEIRFFTSDHIYKFMPEYNAIYIYDDTLTVPAYINPSEYTGEVFDETPSYGYLDNEYLFQGIFINQYDPLIPLNNANNNVFMELHLTYNIEEDVNLLVDAKAINTFANTTGFENPNTFGSHYLSEVSYLQYMSSLEYNSRLEGDNIFSDLQTDFAQVDVNEDLIYPLHSFYGTTDTYTTSFTFDGSVILDYEQTVPEVYIYFNFSYYEDKVDGLIQAYMTQNGITELPITTVDFLRFFQDIVLIIKEGEII